MVVAPEPGPTRRAIFDDTHETVQDSRRLHALGSTELDNFLIELCDSAPGARQLAPFRPPPLRHTFTGEKRGGDHAASGSEVIRDGRTVGGVPSLNRVVRFPHPVVGHGEQRVVRMACPGFNQSREKPGPMRRAGYELTAARSLSAGFFVVPHQKRLVNAGLFRCCRLGSLTAGFRRARCNSPIGRHRSRDSAYHDRPKAPEIRSAPCIRAAGSSQVVGRARRCLGAPRPRCL